MTPARKVEKEKADATRHPWIREMADYAVRACLACLLPCHANRVCGPEYRRDGYDTYSATEITMESNREPRFAAPFDHWTGLFGPWVPDRSKRGLKPCPGRAVVPRLRSPVDTSNRHLSVAHWPPAHQWTPAYGRPNQGPAAGCRLTGTAGN